MAGGASGTSLSLHFFSFGGVARTAHWMSEVSQGRFTFDPGRREIRIAD